jgi:hypothetical protein
VHRGMQISCEITFFVGCCEVGCRTGGKSLVAQTLSFNMAMCCLAQGNEGFVASCALGLGFKRLCLFVEDCSADPSGSTQG